MLLVSLSPSASTRLYSYLHVMNWFSTVPKALGNPWFKSNVGSIETIIFWAIFLIGGSLPCQCMMSFLFKASKMWSYRLIQYIRVLFLRTLENVSLTLLVQQETRLEVSARLLASRISDLFLNPDSSIQTQEPMWTQGSGNRGWSSLQMSRRMSQLRSIVRSSVSCPLIFDFDITSCPAQVYLQNLASQGRWISGMILTPLTNPYWTISLMS